MIKFLCTLVCMDKPNQLIIALDFLFNSVSFGGFSYVTCLECPLAWEIMAT